MVAWMRRALLFCALLLTVPVTRAADYVLLEDVPNYRWKYGCFGATVGMLMGYWDRHGYPDVMVKPLGAVTAVVYQTHKKGDGPSYYIHQMAEISGKFPFLGVDNRGRLWLAGGNYTSPNPGITD